MKYALLISAGDNAAVVTVAVEPGDTVCWKVNGEEASVTAVESVPIYHKIAVREIAAGETVLKYGHSIGVADVDIPKGGYIHCHNIHSPEKEEL